MAIAQKAFTVKKNLRGKDGKSYSVRFMVNGVAVGVLNYNTAKDVSTVTLECDFLLNGEAYTAGSCRLGCYDGEGQLMGSEITSTDASSTIVDGGNLYLSKGCKSIQCAFSIVGGGEHVESLTVVTDGEKGDKGDKGDAACFIRVYSSAGTVYKNHKVSTVLTARVFRGSEDVTDRCTGSFTWYKTENGVGLGLKSDGSNVFSVTGSESYDEVKYMCIYDGDISEKAYGLTYGGKSVTFGGKSVVRYGE